jgi:hypothetical protein
VHVGGRDQKESHAAVAHQANFSSLVRGEERRTYVKFFSDSNRLLYQCERLNQQWIYLSKGPRAYKVFFLRSRR